MSAPSFEPLGGMSPALRRALIAAGLLLLPAILYEGSRTGPLSIALAGLSIVLLGIHAAALLGIARAASFLGICLVITFGIENIGVATGLPFGRYVFLVEDGLPRVGTIPVIVGALYFAFGYQAWIIACLLVGTDVQGPRDRLSLFGVPVIAAFVTTQWDVVVDPPSATIGRAWVWFDGGGYFGVPLSNFLGWLLTTWLFAQIFAFAVFLSPGRVRREAHDPAFLAIPILLYLASGLCHLIPMLDADIPVVDGLGKIWSSADIRETSAIVALFTMLPTSGLALLRLVQRRAAPELAGRVVVGGSPGGSTGGTDQRR